MVAAWTLVAAAPVLLARAVGGDVIAASFVAGGILWSRMPISAAYRSARESLHGRGEIDVQVDALEAHILRMRRVTGWTATASGAATLAFALAAL